MHLIVGLQKGAVQTHFFMQQIILSAYYMPENIQSIKNTGVCKNYILIIMEFISVGKNRQ